jgi:2-amino-4-hydroxy-6-hydroxymethyldihydropteridine diphosphokinase
MSNPSRIPSATFVLGLGSNLGDRLALLQAACQKLSHQPVTLLARSSIYLTPPMGPAQPDYFNCALLLRTVLQPRQLLLQTTAIEESLGRVRPAPLRWGPRTIDIDLLWWSGGCLKQPSLRLPHAGLKERAFALVPLLELLPDARCPESGEPYAELDAAAVELPLGAAWSQPLATADQDAVE